MFSSYVSELIPPLTRSYFSQLSHAYNEKDYVLSFVGLALFRTRIEGYNGIQGFITNTTCPSQEKCEQLITARKADSSKNVGILYNECFLNQAAIDELTTRMKDQGCEEVPSIKAYIKQELGMDAFAAFIHRETNTAFVFSGTTNVSVYHLTWAFIPVLFPEVFKDKPITEKELQILKSLCHKSSSKFVSLISEALMPMRVDILREELESCFATFRQGRIDKQRREIESVKSNMDDLLSRYLDYSQKYDEEMLILEGLMRRNGDAKDEEEEIIEYLAKHPNLDDIQYRDGKIFCLIKTYLTNVDPAKFEVAASRRDIYEGYRVKEPFDSKQNRKVLLDALFKDPNPKLYVKIRSHITLDIARCYMDTVRGELTTNGGDIDNYLTNPHFKLHACPGQNREQIIQCLRHGDIQGAVECSIAATGSVNIGETDLTFRPFVASILASNKKIIYCTDGTDMTPTEALLWLLNKQGEEK